MSSAELKYCYNVLDRKEIEMCRMAGTVRVSAGKKYPLVPSGSGNTCLLKKGVSHPNYLQLSILFRTSPVPLILLK